MGAYDPQTTKEVVGDDRLDVYRIVGVGILETATLVPFRLSNQAKGVRRRGIENTYPEIHEGISAYSSYAHAIAQAGRLPQLGSFIAKIEITADVEARTNVWGQGGHLTIWADALKLAQAVTDILPVDQP